MDWWSVSLFVMAFWKSRYERYRLQKWGIRAPVVHQKRAGGSWMFCVAASLRVCQSAGRCRNMDVWPATHDDKGGAHFIVKVADLAVRCRRRVRSSATTSRRGSARLSPATCGHDDACRPCTRLFATDTVPHRATVFNHFPFCGDSTRRWMRRPQQRSNVGGVCDVSAISWPLLLHVTSDVISWYRALAERR